jgi:hypothetical protein
MHDHRAALRGLAHGLRVHRVAGQPGDAIALARRRAAPERAHFPTCIAQLAGHLAADAARRAQNQNRVVACHE